AGIAVEPFVDRLPGAAEVLGERGRIGIQRAEDEAAIALDARHLGEVVLAVAEIAGVALGPGHAAQLAAVEVGPAVIRALEGRRIAFRLAAHARAAMRAAVEKRAQLAGRVARDDDEAQAEARGEIVVN